MSPASLLALRVTLAALSVAFIPATLLSFRFSSAAVQLLYRATANWMGFANFFFLAASLAWLVDIALRFTVPDATRLSDRPYIAGALLAVSAATAIFGLINARRLRVRTIDIKLARLPEAWRGRRALLISDVHLGHVNGAAFAERIAAKERELNPEIIFIAGDLFDGSKVDAKKMVAPLKGMRPPLGTFFVGGNHEEHGGAAKFEEAVRSAGIRVLHNECVNVEGMRVVGLPYGSESYVLQARSFLEELRLKDGPASILLHHVPNRLSIAEHAGVSLQLSGHTHGGGQFIPYNFITRRAFGQFTYGLQRFGEMQVYTSSGAGTWGPPMRVGTNPEIVLLTFI
ncbi:MAG: metallophosphoesterase [Acidobacteria bacterium]|nr:metallophosphoesterase [Acidobacteriota bacterium]